jgi:hypothetical protein
MKMLAPFVSLVLILYVSSCCFGERFLYTSITITYVGFGSDTTFNLYYALKDERIDTVLNYDLYNESNSQKLIISLDEFGANGTIKNLVVELPSIGRRDTFSEGTYKIKGECKSEVYEEAIKVNGVLHKGKYIEIHK